MRTYHLSTGDSKFHRQAPTGNARCRLIQRLIARTPFEFKMATSAIAIKRIANDWGHYRTSSTRS